MSELLSMLLSETLKTLYMTALATLLSYAAGIPLGIALVLTREGGVKKNRAVYSVLETIINVWRSVPFYIMMIVLIPVARFVLGISIGTTAVCFYLFVGSVPFAARLTEQSMLEVGKNLTETCVTLGANARQIVGVLLGESLPSLVRGISITFVMLIGYSAMAGVMGGGGLGDVAVRYGLHRYQYKEMLIILAVIIVIVMAVQRLFNLLAKKIDKRRL